MKGLSKDNLLNDSFENVFNAIKRLKHNERHKIADNTAGDLEIKCVLKNMKKLKSKRFAIFNYYNKELIYPDFTGDSWLELLNKDLTSKQCILLCKEDHDLKVNSEQLNKLSIGGDIKLITDEDEHRGTEYAIVIRRIK